jgi:hypothetical protein
MELPYVADFATDIFPDEAGLTKNVLDWSIKNGIEFVIFDAGQKTGCIAHVNANV